MVLSVTVGVRDHGTFAFLREMVNRAEKIGLRETWNLTQFGARMIKEQHQRTSKKFERTISNGIKAKKLKKATYGIVIPRQGIFLDRMRPHWVALKRGRAITRWAKQRNIINKKTGKLPRAIEVHAHPFVTDGYLRMVNRLDIVANRIANRIVS